jgi:hypothetical protein
MVSTLRTCFVKVDEAIPCLVRCIWLDRWVDGIWLCRWKPVHVSLTTDIHSILILRIWFNVGQYSQTKLANVLYSKELARRYLTLSVYAVHPGIVRTNVTSNMVWYLRIPNNLFSWYIASIQKTSTQGAYSSVFCAAAPMDRLPTSGSVIHNCKLQATTDVAESRSDAKRLWQVSEQLTGLNQEWSAMISIASYLAPTTSRWWWSCFYCSVWHCHCR